MSSKYSHMSLAEIHNNLLDLSCRKDSLYLDLKQMTAFAGIPKYFLKVETIEELIDDLEEEFRELKTHRDMVITLLYKFR